MNFRATAEIKGGFEEAQRRFDAFRESMLPGTEHGVTMSNLTPTDEADTYTVDVEIDVTSEGAGLDAFDSMREATLPVTKGIALYGLEYESAAPLFGR